VLELPLELQPWEPTYALATFKPTYAEVAEPWEPGAPLEARRPREAPQLEDDEILDALLDLVAPWTTESNGAARAVAVEGDAVAAASSLALDTLRMGVLTADEALQRMAWAAASGGAHGRRRGATLGRFLAWYTAALLAGSAWPVEPDRLGESLASLRFYRWDEGEPEEGWVLRIAVEDGGGWAAALAATDVLADPGQSPSRIGFD
jgi:hypothetical protein